jgi:hypothetical protein
VAVGESETIAAGRAAITVSTPFHSTVVGNPESTAAVPGVSVVPVMAVAVVPVVAGADDVDDASVVDPLHATRGETARATANATLRARFLNIPSSWVGG